MRWTIRIGLSLLVVSGSGRITRPQQVLPQPQIYLPAQPQVRDSKRCRMSRATKRKGLMPLAACRSVLSRSIHRCQHLTVQLHGPYFSGNFSASFCLKSHSLRRNHVPKHKGGIKERRLFCPRAAYAF